MQTRLTSTSSQRPQQAALRFFQAALAVFAMAACLAWGLVRILPPAPTSSDAAFPAAFWFSSILLLVGSVQLQRATAAVRRERQPAFRRALTYAVCAGTLFLAVQSYGLKCLLTQQHGVGVDVATSAGPFVFVFSFLHALHFFVAVLFLVFVTVRAFADRYDHEYYWGVIVCSYFWHALGIVWLAILSVFAIIAL